MVASMSSERGAMSSMRSRSGGTEMIENIEAEIIHVVLNVFVNEECAIGADLPQPGYTRLYRQTLLLQRCISFDDERHLRPWTDQRHLSQPHIDQLRYLVETCAAEKASDRGYSRIFVLQSANSRTSARRHTSSGTCTSGREALLCRRAPAERKPGRVRRTSPGPQSAQPVVQKGV